MAFRTWGRLLLTALGVSLLAGAGQLGIAFGFGVVRLTGAFTGGTVNQWPAQLAWVGWFAANAAVVGAVLTERLARRDGLLTGTGRQLAVAGAAALGATVVAPLCMQPARAAELISVDPVWAVAICAILGAAVGSAAALAVLVRPPLGWNMALVAGVAWLLALVSVAPSLAGTGPLSTVRLGVLEPSWLAADAAQRLAMLVLPLVALLAGAATGGVARWRGHPPLVGGLTGVAGPTLLAFAYLTAGPGGGVDRYQTTPYYGALLAVVAGALGSAAAVLLRWPLIEQPVAESAVAPAPAAAIEPTDILRPLPAGRALPPATTTTSPAEAAGTVSGTGFLVGAAGTPAGAGAGAPGGGAPRATAPVHWDWPTPGGKRAPEASTPDTPEPAQTPPPASSGPDTPASDAAGSATVALSTPAASPPRPADPSHSTHLEASSAPATEEPSGSTTSDGAAGPDNRPAVAKPAATTPTATPAAGAKAPRPRRGRRVKAPPVEPTDTTARATDEGAASAAGEPTAAPPDAAPAGGPPRSGASDTDRSDPTPTIEAGPPPAHPDPAPAAGGGPVASAPHPDHPPTAENGPVPPTAFPASPVPVAPARPAPMKVGPESPSRPAPTPITPPRPAPTRVGPEPFVPLPPTPLAPAQPAPRRVEPDPFTSPSGDPGDDGTAAPAPRPRHRAPLPDLNSAGTWDAFATARSTAPARTDLPTTETNSTPTETGPTAGPAPTGATAPGTASDGAEPTSVVDRLTAAFTGADRRTVVDGTTVPPPGHPADGEAPGPGTGDAAGSAEQPKRRGLFRRTRSRTDQTGPAGDAEPLPAQDEEFVDWVTGLSKPLPDNEPAQESGRRSLRSTGRHHGD